MQKQKKKWGEKNVLKGSRVTRNFLLNKKGRGRDFSDENKKKKKWRSFDLFPLPQLQFNLFNFPAY